MSVATFGRDLKGLVPVGYPCFGEPLLNDWLLPWNLKNKDGWWKRLDVSRELRSFQEVKSMLWPRRMHQALRFDQPISKLTRLMAHPSNRLVGSRR